MDNCNMNRPCFRPYHATCGMARMNGNSCTGGRQCSQTQTQSRPSCRMPAAFVSDRAMYEHVDHMEPAMAYVPCQEFTNTYDLCYAFHVGTIFPQLCKPFCGKRGVRR